jgi:hypothetical protein
MGKKLKNTSKIIAILSGIMVLNLSVAFAAPCPDPSNCGVVVSAAVDSVLELGIGIREELTGNPLTLGTTELTAMNHGTLVRSSNPDTGAANALRGKAFHVFLGANTSSRQYQITSTMNALTGAGGTLPRALGVFPGVATSDGSGLPAGDIPGDALFSAQDAVGANKVLYTSNPAGQGAVVDIIYGLSGGNADLTLPFPGWEPVPPGQAPGTYSTTVIYTLSTL